MRTIAFVFLLSVAVVTGVILENKINLYSLVRLNNNDGDQATERTMSKIPMQTVSEGGDEILWHGKSRNWV